MRLIRPSRWTWPSAAAQDRFGSRAREYVTELGTQIGVGRIVDRGFGATPGNLLMVASATEFALYQGPFKLIKQNSMNYVSGLLELSRKNSVFHASKLERCFSD